MMDETETLSVLERRLHELIRLRNVQNQEAANLDLPGLNPLPPTAEEPAWFPVPGMCGGFKYWLEHDGEQIKLITESWCRVVDGSGQRHEITVDSCRLIAEGFV